MQPKSSDFRRAALIALAGGLLVQMALTGAVAVTAALPAVAESIEVSAAPTRPAVRLLPPNRVMFPMAPTPRCDVLDNYGDSRSGGRTHQGTDILATLGQAVYAVVDGTITLRTAVGDKNAELSGNLLQLTGADKTYFVYAHLSAFADGIVRGSVVKRGEIIGFVGDTGNPGPGNYHLHFEVHPGGGAAANAVPLMLIPAECRVF
jgi:murein DD-endopeptidase MepM/ murein hydrolase activator NlpD